MLTCEGTGKILVDAARFSFPVSSLGSGEANVGLLHPFGPAVDM